MTETCSAATVSTVDVETQPDGSLLVRWSLAGGPGDVAVAAGPTPALVDHRHQTHVPAGCHSLKLQPSGSGRTFVSVAPAGGGPAVVAADRRVAFSGVSNFRDLGGYRTGAGGRLRWGQVFRADGLHGLSPSDLIFLGELGLKVVYDLREDVEREERPDPIPALAYAIIGRPGADPSSIVPSGLTAEEGERFLEELYVGMIEHSAPRIGRLYSRLAGPGGLPALFHCHAGKDRTGVVAAILLEAVGVDRETVLDDYELTSRYRAGAARESSFDLLIRAGLSAEAAAAVLTTPRTAMAGALGYLDERYGGAEAYLRGPAGMSGAELRNLQALLVE